MSARIRVHRPVRRRTRQADDAELRRRQIPLRAPLQTAVLSAVRTIQPW